MIGQFTQVTALVETTFTGDDPVDPVAVVGLLSEPLAAPLSPLLPVAEPVDPLLEPLLAPVSSLLWIFKVSLAVYCDASSGDVKVTAHMPSIDAAFAYGIGMWSALANNVMSSSWLAKSSTHQQQFAC